MAIKTAYLTIDDAPSPYMKQKVDFLLNKGIPAIFFCLGQAIEQQPDTVIYAIQNGFIIGNHSYSHPHFSSLTLEEAYEEIQRADIIIDEMYQCADTRRPAKFFRFPFGDKGGLVGDYPIANYSEKGATRKKAIQQHLRKLGYAQPVFNITTRYYREAGLLDEADWYWTFDTFDWSVNSDNPANNITSLEAIYARMDENQPERACGLNCPESEEIILIHDRKDCRELFIPIIERLQEKGLQFILPACQ